MSIKTVEFQPFTDQKPGTYVSLRSPSPPLLSYPASFPSTRVGAWRRDNDNRASTPSSLSHVTMAQRGN